MGVEKDIDILCVSRVSSVKNLPILIKALKLYHQKYQKRLKAVLITGVKDKKFNDSEKEILKTLEQECGGHDELNKYIEIIGQVPHGDALNKYYTRSRFVVLTSIYEGKNRAINEANLCNTPVIIFKALSKYTRGEDKAFGPGCGLYAPEFSPESLCDTIREGMLNQDKFSPRRGYLSFNGRMNFINKCIDSIPYYRENLPEYVPGRIQDNMWVDLSMQANYQLSFNAFLYGANTAIHNVKLHEENTGIMDFFNARFMIKGGEKILPNKKE